MDDLEGDLGHLGTEVTFKSRDVFLVTSTRGHRFPNTVNTTILRGGSLRKVWKSWE